ncbi:MAG TPA: hypothetical protein VGF59_01005 [Bryobacteraceae bacterium]|jgi:outer membrane protein assembly factor BamB
MRRLQAIVIGGAFLWTGAAHAQFGRGGGWATSGGDAQRSFWVRSDAKISPQSMQKPGAFAVTWRVKVPGDAKTGPIAPPVLLERYIGYRGFRSLGYVSGSSDNIVAIDTDLGRVEWTKRATSAAAACPGLTSSLTNPVSPAIAPAPAGGRGGNAFGGRGGPAKSAVGETDEGAVTIKQVSEMAARGGQGGQGGRGGRGPQPNFPRVRSASYVHILASDGMLHNMYVSNGEEPEAAVKFLPPGAKALGLIFVDSVAYAAAGQNCGSAPDAIYALNLESKEAANWKPASGGIAGSTGPAIGPDGTVYVATSAGDLVALEGKTLKMKDAQRIGQPLNSSPVIFEMGEKTIIAVSSADGKIHLLDVKALGSSNASGSAAVTGGAIASWQDPAGTRWLLGATNNGIAAWKVVEQNGSLALQPGWTKELASALNPAIVNGVVFTATGGSAPGVLYALDGATGKELWNSGKLITASVRGGGLSIGENQVYIGTNDTLYAFGFPIEH